MSKKVDLRSLRENHIFTIYYFKHQLLQKIQENQARLDRLRSEPDALKRVEQEQQAVLQQMNA